MLRLVLIAAVSVLIGCDSGRPDRATVTGKLSPEDMSRITETVQRDLASRKRSGRIKSLDETNGTVTVWYADKQARWGEAGYILEHATNGWKITTELFR